MGYLTRIYIRLALRGDTCPIGNLGIYWYLLLFDMYLPASTHFMNLSFFILLGFLLSI